MESLKKLLPFLTEKELNELLEKILQSPNQEFKDVKLKDLLVFLNPESIDNLFLDQLKKGQDVTYILPFVGHETLKNIVELYCNSKLDYEIDINKLAMFLTPEDISLLYQYMTK